MTATAATLAALLLASLVGHAIKNSEIRRLTADVTHWRGIARSETRKRLATDEALAAALADRPLAPVLPIRGGAS